MICIHQEAVCSWPCSLLARQSSLERGACRSVSQARQSTSKPECLLNHKHRGFAIHPSAMGLVPGLVSCALMLSVPAGTYFARASRYSEQYCSAARSGTEARQHLQGENDQVVCPAFLQGVPCCSAAGLWESLHRAASN